MREFDWEMVEKERMPFEDRVTLAVARVQGSWDQKSKDLLSKHSFLGSISEEDGEAKGIEKAFIAFVSKTAASVVGDESYAGTLLGHPVTLPERDRGILVLVDFFNEGSIERLQDWKNSVVIAQEITKGKNLTEILENFKKKSENLGGLGEILRRFDVDKEQRTKDFIEYLEALSGGSEEALLTNKKGVEEELVESLKHELRELPLFKLILISRELNSEHKTEDKIVFSSIGSARYLFKELVQPDVDELFRLVS